MLPETLNIQGKHFNITYKDKLADNNMVYCGCAYVDDQRIEINTAYPVECQESTLLHEVIEVINDLNELGLKHWQICVLETGLYQVLKENKIF